MHTDSDPRPAPRAMDIMRPSQAFAVPPTSTFHDARRWMRLGLAALASAISLSVLLATRARS
jgi:hypothetical protein